MNSEQYQSFYESLRRTELESWLDELPAQVSEALQAHGNYVKWAAAIDALPALTPTSIDLTSKVRIGTVTDVDGAIRETLRNALMQLHPWRKGPFSIYGLHLDTEWRSDWKWDRLKDAITPLTNRRVLDVGCGNGYHCWRMLGAGAKQVIGIDPTIVFVMQFWAIEKLLTGKQTRRQGDREKPFNIADHRRFEKPSSTPNSPIVIYHSQFSSSATSQPHNLATVLPLGVESLPHSLHAFDTVFSMGVLYHRRSPFDHLFELRDALRSGGELVLETLVIDGKLGEVLVPQGRYAQMRNVWFLPSVLTLEAWLKKAKFRNVKLIDVTPTTTEEQRTTEWMTFHSLKEFLNPNDSSRTVEGFPAPIRAVFSAEAP